jgi:transcription elongation factor Elf1
MFAGRAREGYLHAIKCPYCELFDSFKLIFSGDYGYLKYVCENCGLSAPTGSGDNEEATIKSAKNMLYEFIIKMEKNIKNKKAIVKDTRIKSCPNCNKKSLGNIAEVELKTHRKVEYSLYQVECNLCGMKGPHSLTDTAAIEHWNEMKME